MTSADDRARRALEAARRRSAAPRTRWPAPLYFAVVGVLRLGVGLAGAPAHAAVASEPTSSDEAAAPAGAPADPGPRAAPGRPTAVVTSSAPDLEALRSEYDRLREALFKARVRSQKVAETVYPTRFDVRLRWKGSPDFVIRKARFLLDGAALWDSADRAGVDDLIEVASRPIKPGPHALTVSLEVRPKTEAKGGTVTGAARPGHSAEHVFAIVAPPGGQMHLVLVGDEDGDPPDYETSLELEVETEK